LLFASIAPSTLSAQARVLRFALLVDLDCLPRAVALRHVRPVMLDRYQTRKEPVVMCVKLDLLLRWVLPLALIARLDLGVE
jgi:hypothetical protein